jgi:hypothetical protein
VQKDFQAVFGKEGVAVFEISFAEGNDEVIDLALHDYKIAIELKLNPSSRRAIQKAWFMDKASSEKWTLAFVDQKKFEVLETGDQLSAARLKRLEKQVAKLDKELTKGIGAIGKARDVGKYVKQVDGDLKLERMLLGFEEGSRLVKGAKTVLELSPKALKAAKAIFRGGVKAAPFIGAGISIAEGINHLQEGRYIRAAVDFAEAIPRRRDTGR